MSTVICLGEVLFDLLADQVGVGNDQTSWTPLAGGAPANVACGMMKMSINEANQARFIGCVGNDQPGRELTAKLREIGVDISGVQYHPTAPTRQVQVLRTMAGDRSFGGFGAVASDQFADAQLSQVPPELFVGADFLLLGTLALAYPASATSTWRAVELAKAQGVKILVDVNWRPSFWVDPNTALVAIRQLLAQANFIKFAREEAELLYQETMPLALCKHLPQAEGIVVTDGGNICQYWLQGEVGEQPAFAVDAIDTTGAGDAFVAGLLQQLGMGKSAAATIRYAAAAGALTTLKPGAIDAQPTHAEILHFLQTRD
jgi:fructokinase